MVEPVIYAGVLYFLYVYIDQRDINFRKKLTIVLLLLPTILLISTNFGFLGYDLTSCDRDAIEGPLVYYSYFVEIVFIFWVLFLGIKRFFSTQDREIKKKIILITVGSLGFLTAFAFGNIIGSLLDSYSIIGEDYSWTLGQYGLFGVPVFMAFLSYVIVKYKAFNIKVIGAQILILALVILIAATLLVQDPFYSQIITAITLIIVIGLGYSLSNSVQKEVEQREKIEKLAKELEGANIKLKELDQMKSEFLSLATHQIRAPLTAIKGYSSMLLEGDFGVLPQKALDSVQTIMKSCQGLINIVGDFLNISRIEQGEMVYEKSIFDAGEVTREVINEIKPNLDKTGLSFDTDISAEKIQINADKDKIKQAIGNIIDNAIKYTSKGSIFVSVYKKEDRVNMSVKDSGVGIDPSEINKLFNKFSRTKDANKTSVTGTGLGLYVAKKIVEAHQGNIKVSSEGVGKGSTFTIELPIYKT